MKTVQKSLRMPEEVAREIEAVAETARRDFSSVTNEMLMEAVKMRHCPGIVFVDGAAGRRPRIAGTGIDVWEVIAEYQAGGRDPQSLREAFHWLTDLQLRTALGYYAAYPEEIDRWIEGEDSWTPERVAREYPLLSPRRQ